MANKVDVPKLCEARCDSHYDVNPHSDVSIELNSQVCNGVDKYDRHIANMNRSGRDEMLMQRWRAPDDFGFSRIM